MNVLPHVRLACISWLYIKVGVATPCLCSRIGAHVTNHSRLYRHPT